MNNCLLEVRDATKSFDGVYVLKQVGFRADAGEVIALAGENGAGKSTLMKAIAGVHCLDSGQIYIDGAPVAIRTVADANRLGISFIHQELNLIDSLDIAANVFLGRELAQTGPLRILDRFRMEEETQKLLKRLGSSIEPNTLVQDLSIAQQQLVEIAKALSLNARIIILDEPTASLTHVETENLLRVISELRAGGTVVIYISHRMLEIEQIADRVVVMRDGSIQGELNGIDITRSNIVRLMIGREISQLFPERTHREASRSKRFEVSLATQRFPSQVVSFAIKAGEILGMSGLIGAGRSEVAETIFGAQPSLHQHIVVDGKAVDIESPKDAIKAGIYLVPENRRDVGLIARSSIRENIGLPALKGHSWLGFIDSASELREVQAICKKLTIRAHSVEEKVVNLSGGNQQKIVLGKWLQFTPKVLIVDEPTRGVDIGAKAEIYDLMRKLADDGIAMLMISSDLEEILGMSDRVVVMHEGVITGTLEQAECSEEVIMQLAVGSVKSERPRAISMSGEQI